MYEPAAENSGVRIVLFSEDVHWSEPVALILRHEGHRCTVVPNMAAARALLEDEARTVDVVLYDLRFGEPAPLDLGHQAQISTIDVPVVIVLPTHTRDDELFVPMPDTYSILREPFTSEQLSHSVKAALRRQPPTTQPRGEPTSEQSKPNPEQQSLLAEARARNTLLRREILAREEAETALERERNLLEQRVAERTADLARVNQDLVEQIVEQQRLRTREQALAAQLRHAQKMEAVGRLAGGVAHDFNNLLMVINGTSDLLLAELTDDDPIRTDLRDILHAGQRAAKLTSQLLTFSRQHVLRPERLNLNTVVAGIEPMVRRIIGHDVALVIRLADDLAPVFADAGQIEQIIVNLVVNARDAMPDGGELTLETANVTIDKEATEADVSLPNVPAEQVLLRVSDTGTGMNEEVRARIFEPFFTTKPEGKGTGLGLATVFGIVEQSGGTVQVESELGRGSTFTACLPRIHDRRKSPRAATVPAAAPRGGSETVLLVEDDDNVRQTTARFLISYGYDVHEAADAATALAFVDGADHIDLLITDVMMPGIDGIDLAAEFALRRPGIPVIFVSGRPDRLVDHLGPGGLGDIAGATVLPKPFTSQQLARRVREQLDQ